MNDCMTFPDTVEEFMEQYKIIDTEQVYTNGTEFVPIFRMKQWFEHLSSAQPVDKDTNVPTNDIISRQAAMNACKNPEDGEYAYAYGDEIEKRLKALPLAEQWIPVSERLPEEDLFTGGGKQFSNSVLMTVYDKNDEDTIVDYGHTTDGEWYSDTADEFIESIADWKVIAWMPLPEPYKEEEE